MEKHILTVKQLASFYNHLQQEEREPGTIEKYIREMKLFMRWQGRRPVTKEAAAGWKEHLRTEGYKPETINAKLSALNKFFVFVQWPECRLRYLKIQRKLFRNAERELTRNEYIRLLETAGSLGKKRLALLIETIGATGIRVSEVKYITAEAVRTGRTDISLKGKIRTILLPHKLCQKLQKYAQKQKKVGGQRS